jgi:phosphoribosylglycinamide formyltransferase-1
MAAILRAASHGRLAATAEVVLVCSNRAEAAGLECAQALGFETACLPSRGVGRAAHGAALLALLEPYELDWLVLAGYTRILSPPVVQRYWGRIVNIHPADSRKYRGLHGYRWAFEQGLSATFVTVHLVDEGIDTGPILTQAPVDLVGAASIEEVEARGLRVEHELFPATLERLWRGESGSDPAASEAQLARPLASAPHER